MNEKLDQADRDADAGFKALFQSVEQPRPRDGFVERTMLALGQDTLPSGRRPLQRPWIAPLRWAAVIAASIAAVWGAAINLASVASAFAWLLARTILAPLRLLQFIGTAVDLWGFVAKTGEALGKGLATREASTVLIVVTLIGLTSLAILRRLLVSENESWF